MENAVSRLSGYALGHDAHELTRLGRQGEVFLPFTRQLFEEAVWLRHANSRRRLGAGRGFWTGLCWISVLLTVKSAVAAVRTRSLARRTENVEFLLGDPTEMVFRAPFDAVVGRFVLMYYPDPIHAIRSLARHLRPGGIMVLQEFDISYVRSHPAPLHSSALQNL
jgi:SAM-dependent methyltransferase